MVQPSRSMTCAWLGHRGRPLSAADWRASAVALRDLQWLKNDNNVIMTIMSFVYFQASPCLNKH